MITTNIGKTFLKAYNEKYRSNYTPRQFFEQIYCELFYNHNKYMMTAGNSPLENPKIRWGEMRKGITPYETPEKRLERIRKTIDKIEQEPIGLNTAIGYPSRNILATTSGQITNLNLPLGKDDAFLSWIGAGLNVGIQGGLSILFADPQLLLDIYEGWSLYRSYLNEYPELRGNQIATWNGQWLCHRYDKQKYNPEDKTAFFTPFGKTRDGSLEIKTQSWSWLMFRLAEKLTAQSQTAYVYNLGHTNTTIGFIRFELSQIHTLDKLYDAYLGTTNRDIAMQLTGTALSFSQACRTGSINKRALEPKGFPDATTKGYIPGYPANKQKQLTFNTYKTWLFSMINNETLWKKAEDIAQLLHDYSQTDKNAKTRKIREIEEVLKSTRQRQFIEGLTTIVKNSDEVSALYEIGKLIDSLPDDNVSYLLTLIRFNYAVISKTRQKQ